MIFLLIYVDDILQTSNDQESITTLLHLLNQEFPIRNLSNARFFFGIELFSNSEGRLPLQRKCIIGILQRAKMNGAHPISIPTVVGNFFTPSFSPAIIDPQMYRSIVRVLQYITITRSDIAFVINPACQFMHAPTK